MHCSRCGHKTTERIVDGMPRPVCRHCGAVTYLDPRLAVTAVIFQDDHDGPEVLLGRRAAHTRNPGGWSFPAGFVNRGERVEDAVEREVREETALSVRLGPLLGVWSARGDGTVLLAWVVSSWSGTPEARDDLTAIAWHPVSRLPALAFGHDREIIERALATRETAQATVSAADS